MDTGNPGGARGVWKGVAGLACVVVAAFGIGAAASPAAGGSPKLDATLTATITGGGAWCCGSFSTFAGSAVVMGVGAVDVSGSRSAGCALPFVPTTCFRRLDLLLVARNGDQLAITGDDSWGFPSGSPPAETSWNVDPARSTGRFAGFTASGTYTFASANGIVTIALTGVRHTGRTRVG